MSKTVDDLMEAFRTGFRQRMQGPGIRPEGDVAIRAGIAAVVRALRDAICKQYGFRKIWDDFDSILGSDAGEKVATACATSQTTGVTDDNRQGERERHFPQGLQAVDGGGAEAVGRCERRGSSLTRRDQSQLAFESAILGDYEARRGRNVGGESNHRLNEKVAGGSVQDAASGSIIDAAPATDPAPAVCEITAERDRLKAALEFIARGTTGSPDAIIARKALGGDAS